MRNAGTDQSHSVSSAPARHPPSDLLRRQSCRCLHACPAVAAAAAPGRPQHSRLGRSVRSGRIQVTAAPGPAQLCPQGRARRARHGGGAGQSRGCAGRCLTRPRWFTGTPKSPGLPGEPGAPRGGEGRAGAAPRAGPGTASEGRGEGHGQRAVRSWWSRYIDS
ncbi:putative polyketide hydroxylase isoform X2 [Prinia subflava]|uniref:putative polyketide hydroxylase isoform X2 n=1 Tax=Prinia subflava TaxID=208062 RepID=UPI002FE1ACAE